MNHSIPENCWNSWVLPEPDSCCTSGYGTAENTPDSEALPVDWEVLVDKLTSLDPVKPVEEQVQQSLFLSIDPTGEFQTHRNCIFYITMVNSKPKDLEDLSLVIVGPSGHRYPVLQFTRLSDRVACTFRPLEPGTYTLSGFFRDVFHIQGSPCHLSISRDYQKQFQRPIVSLDVELMDSSSSVEPSLESRKPWGLCCNTKTEQLLVADREKHEILVFGPDGEFNFRFGGHGRAPGEFFRPTALAYDTDGDRIFVSDKDNHRIQIFNARGDFLSMFGSRGGHPGQFLFPWGVAVSRDGALIAVADSRNHRIQLFNAEGRYIRQFRVTTSWKCKEYKTKFDYPRGIAFNLSGDALYVTDFNLETVFQLDINFTTCITLVDSGSLHRPSGITVDDVGNILVCDSKNNTIKIFQPDGQLIGSLDNIGASRMDLPLDIALMKTGFLAILDLNGRVRII